MSGALDGFGSHAFQKALFAEYSGQKAEVFPGQVVHVGDGAAEPNSSVGQGFLVDNLGGEFESSALILCGEFNVKGCPVRLAKLFRYDNSEAG